MKNRKGRSIAGIVIIVVAFAGVFPIVYGLVAKAIDGLLKLPPLLGSSLSIILSAAFWLVGAFWVFWAYSYIMFVGGGSPIEVFGLALEPTKQLVTTGPYAFTRNPMIFGLLWILLGVAVLIESIGGLILLPIIAFGFTIYLKMFEEPGLSRRFNGEYHHYRDHVPLLFPKLITYIKPTSVET